MWRQCVACLWVKCYHQSSEQELGSLYRMIHTFCLCISRNLCSFQGLQSQQYSCLTYSLRVYKYWSNVHVFRYFLGSWGRGTRQTWCFDTWRIADQTGEHLSKRPVWQVSELAYIPIHLLLLSYKGRTQYMHVSHILDTSIKHPISGQSMVKGCMDIICLMW